MGRGAEFLVPRARVRPGATVIEVPQTAIDLAKHFEGFERKVRRGVEITAVPDIRVQVETVAEEIAKS